MEDDKTFGDIGKTEVEDVNLPETPAEKTTPVAPEQGSEELDNVPFHQHPRWKEVYSKAQRVDALEKQLAELSQKVAQPKSKEEEWQPKTWSEVQQKIQENLMKELNRQQEQTVSQQAAEDKALGEAISTLKAEKGEFDEKKLLEVAWKYQISDLSKAHDILTMETAAEQRGEKQALRKRIAPIGSSKKTEGGTKAQQPYNKFKRRTLDDIVNDAAERISG